MERLYDKLKAYSESDFYAFHMPGHKRNKTLLGIELPYDLDITEIDGCRWYGRYTASYSHQWKI